MIDGASISTLGGIVLWQRSYTGAPLTGPANELRAALVSSTGAHGATASTLHTASHTLVHVLSNSLERGQR